MDAERERYTKFDRDNLRRTLILRVTWIQARLVTWWHRVGRRARQAVGGAIVPAKLSKDSPGTAECCVLFMHHKNDALTNYHLDLVRRLNPYPVIPIHRDGEGVAGAFDADTPEWADEPKWAGADIEIYEWFRRERVEAKRYVIIEYDVLATQPLRAFFDRTWDADAVAPLVKLYGWDEWYWFREVPDLPIRMRPYAAGMFPLALMLLSHRALAMVSSMKLPHGIFAELRLGTALRAAGFELTEHPTAKRTVRWRATGSAVPEAEGIYHPVKALELAGNRASD